MASPFQQEVRQRKLLYLALIVVLFTASWGWRKYLIDEQASRLAVREESRGVVDLTGAVVRLGLTGSRGFATCFLWNSAIEKQKKNQWNELEVLVRSLTKLQPHFITPWLFQSWNLAYNVSVESDRIRDKYFYVTRGVELLSQGERQNRNHPDLRWSIGFYLQHKIMMSDETNYQRSLFQLSLIPPHDRDPARFYKQTAQGPEFNYVEFERFCQKNPQLVRRLREGIRRHNIRERKRLFECSNPEAVVRFLEENYQVPSMYRVAALPLDRTGRPVQADARTWNPNPAQADQKLDPDDRFPPLPPPHSGEFDPQALTTDSDLRDDTDAPMVCHAWFSYAQEPLPAPGKLPGSSEEITDRARQRRPRNMTTLIFRNYPAQARRYTAERLQDEGWFDEEAWDISDWFQDVRDPAVAGKVVKVGGGRPMSRQAWTTAYLAWEKHGKDNHILFDRQAQEENERELAERFWKRHNLPFGTPPPPTLRTDQMDEQQKRELEAARFMFELGFYRNVSNFMHHYNRALVEKNDETIACHKLFDRAERLHLAGESLRALNVYQTPVKLPAWGGRTLSPLDAWRELVLLRNKAFREDTSNQETSAEIQVRYLMLYNRQQGPDLKRTVVKAAGLLPLVPRLDPDTFRPPVVRGPFDGEDDKGKKIVEDRYMDLAMERMGLPTRRLPPPGPPPEAVESMMRKKGMPPMKGK